MLTFLHSFCLVSCYFSCTLSQKVPFLFLAHINFCLLPHYFSCVHLVWIIDIFMHDFLSTSLVLRLHVFMHSSLLLVMYTFLLVKCYFVTYSFFASFVRRSLPILYHPYSLASSLILFLHTLWTSSLLPVLHTFLHIFF